jgi:MYXO-CTERM domain-containing protein
MKTSTRFHGVASVRAVTALLAAFAIASQALNGGAQTVTLAPGDNSSVQVNTTGPGAGVVNWTVDGQNILDPAANGAQWFYYSFGGGTPTGIQNFGAAVSSGITNLSPDSQTFGTTYTSGSQSLQAVYQLNGSPVGSGISDLQLHFQYANTTGSQQIFHFFQYVYFTVGANPTASLYTINPGSGPLIFLGQVQGSGFLANEYVDATLTPGAPEGTINPALLSVATLTSTPGFTLPGAADATGPGSAWMLQWNATLNPGDSFTINKDIQVTGAPEPAASSLLFLGLAAFGAFRFLRRRSAA